MDSWADKSRFLRGDIIFLILFLVNNENERNGQKQDNGKLNKNYFTNLCIDEMRWDVVKNNKRFVWNVCVWWTYFNIYSKNGG